MGKILRGCFPCCELVRPSWSLQGGSYVQEEKPLRVRKCDTERFEMGKKEEGVRVVEGVNEIRNPHC